MSQLTTHILDISIGKPARDVPVALHQLVDEFRWIKMAEGSTDSDGRIKNLLPDTQQLEFGVYKLVFHTNEYFEREGIDSFYPSVEVMFNVDSNQHYHVPLLLSPYGFSTYRGS